MDGKNDENAAQCVPMLDADGVPTAVIDDMNVRPELTNKVALSPLEAFKIYKRITARPQGV